MSIYKSEHYEETGFIFWIKGLFGAKCPSYVTLHRYSEGEEKVICTKKLGHKSRHSGVEKSGKIWGWAYGDKWVNE